MILSIVCADERISIVLHPADKPEELEIIKVIVAKYVNSNDGINKTIYVIPDSPDGGYEISIMVLTVKASNQTSINIDIHSDKNNRSLSIGAAIDSKDFKSDAEYLINKCMPIALKNIKIHE